MAKYTLRNLLAMWNHGVARTYIYELIDEGTDPTNKEDNFGLLYNNAAPKPAYTALRNLIALLADHGPAFAPQSLKWSMAGDTANVEDTLLEKRDGSFYLALWLAVPSTDHRQSRSVTLTMPSSINQAKLYQFDVDGNMTSGSLTITPSGQIGLKISDTVEVVKLRRS
jgi:hypothetical protein